MGLKTIAADMLAQAKATGRPQQRELAQGRPGLNLTARYTDNHYTLSLARKTLMPSQVEEGLCRTFFGVPPHATREAVVNGKWRIVRLTWPDVPPAEQTTLPGAGQPAGDNYYERG